MSDKLKLVPDKIAKTPNEDTWSFRLNLDINWDDLIDQANILQKSVKALGDEIGRAHV